MEKPAPMPPRFHFTATQGMNVDVAGDANCLRYFELNYKYINISMNLNIKPKDINIFL